MNKRNLVIGFALMAFALLLSKGVNQGFLKADDIYRMVGTLFSTVVGAVLAFGFSNVKDDNLRKKEQRKILNYALVVLCQQLKKSVRSLQYYDRFDDRPSKILLTPIVYSADKNNQLIVDIEALSHVLADHIDIVVLISKSQGAYSVLLEAAEMRRNYLEQLDINQRLHNNDLLEIDNIPPHELKNIVNEREFAEAEALINTCIQTSEVARDLIEKAVNELRTVALKLFPKDKFVSKEDFDIK